ncbi:MAG: DUF4340 domain-containing protein [Clostridia bacterium]|nr:DUF4340 domain-containing protein [Clostridia bacterium]
MMKRLRPLIILASTAIILGVVLFVLVKFVLPKDEAGEEKGNAVVLLDVDLDEADSIEINNTFDKYTLLKAAIGSYYIEGKKGYDISNDSVLNLLENIGSLSATKKVVSKPSEEQLESYGLTKPYGTVKVVDGSDVYELSFGTTSSSGNYYTRLKGDDAVYLVGTAVPDVVLLSRYQFYFDQMIDYTGETADLEGLTDIIIGGSKREQEIVVKMNELGDDEVGSSYVMTSPIYQSFSNTMQDSLNELMTTLATCAVVSDDTSNAKLVELGLKDPEYTLTYVLDEEKVEIHFGKKTEAEMRYCYVPGDKFIHYIAESYVTCLGENLKAYCEDMIYTRAADALSGIKIVGKDKTFTIAIGDETDEEGNFNVTINNKKVDSELFSDFYAHILTIGITDLGQKGENNTPYLTVEYTLKSGVKETMKFYSVSELKCFCELNGSGNFWVSTMSVDKILENAQKLYNGEVISTEW